MKSEIRYRVMHKFWLDLKKEDEDWLDEQINLLKRSRKYTAVLRDALRLILDLRAGKIDVLFELFPWVKETLEQPSMKSPAGLERQLERLEAMLKEQGGIFVDQAPKPIGLKATLALPTFDDEDEGDTIILNKTTNTNIMDNFFASFAKLGS